MRRHYVLNLNMPAGLHVGYVSADVDPLPERRLRQLGIQVDELDEVALSFNDLSHYDAIVVGIRGCKIPLWLCRGLIRDCLDYVKSGGLAGCACQREAVWRLSDLAPLFTSKMDEARSNGEEWDE